jgi:hypothetical protein
LLGFGTSGIGGLGLEEAYDKYGIGAAAKIANRVKLAQMFPAIAGLGYLLNQIQEVDPNQKGILGGTLGPQLRNLASRFFPRIKSFEEKERERKERENFIDSPYFQLEEIPEKRETDSMREERERKERAARVQQFANESLENRIAETGGDPSAFMYGLVPGVAQSMNQGLRASNIGKMLAKRAAGRALTGKEAKYDRSGLNRKISSGGFSRR